MFSEKKNQYQGECSENASIAPTYHEVDRSDILICAVNGRVYAVRKSNGSTIWKHRKHKFASVTSVFVTDKDRVIAGALGETTCMDLHTGNVIWKNKMPGFGVEEVAITCNPTHFYQPIGGSNLGSNSNADVPMVFACSQGKIMAINGDTGSEIWKYDCPGGTYTMPVCILELSSSDSTHPMSVVYVGAGPCVYCLTMDTGIPLWTTKLSRTLFSTSYMTLATPWNSRLAAETYTSFNQNPSGQTLDRISRGDSV